MNAQIKRLVAGLALCLGSAAAMAQDVVPVVSARSPIARLDAAQVADIFLGKTSRFPDGSIAMPVDQSEDSPVRDRFYAQFTGKSPAQVKAYWSKVIFTGRGQPPRQAADSTEVKRIVSDNPHAIGYIDASQVDSSVRVLAAR
ncbi:MAG TPA: phosphate ABC transporter substrate-binding protein [Usitatibacter sp.]|jgi:ABC-type phosphate transport system substrate-binding protein|nr:phosphate ABC transporter substrate-binding protein [Usitatibacter sp.]